MVIVEAGLVEWGQQWPGLTTYGWRFGVSRAFKRPEWFFDPQRRHARRCRPELNDDELFELLMGAVRIRELEHQKQQRRRGLSFMAGLQRDRDWERAYAAARARLLAGLEAVFPVGTYWLRRFAGVTVGRRAPL